MPGPFSWQLRFAGLALGFGIGGFFDGILLHQILQWHHLLSGIEQARYDIRILILWDGLFHLLMYIIAGIGLWLLWRGRNEFSAAGAERRLLSNALVGFGGWHILDGVFSHWILGIHRIRMDVDNPLFWDLSWFAVFGIMPVIVGGLVRRGGADQGTRFMSSSFALVLVTAVAGPLAALPPTDQTQVVVLFRPDISEAQALTAILKVDAKILGSDPSGQMWAIDIKEGNSSALYRYGAVLVSNSLLPLGCFSWTRA